MLGSTYYISFRPMCLIVITTGTEDNFTINFLIVKKVGFFGNFVVEQLDCDRNFISWVQSVLGLGFENEMCVEDSFSVYIQGYKTLTALYGIIALLYRK